MEALRLGFFPRDIDRVLAAIGPQQATQLSDGAHRYIRGLRREVAQRKLTDPNDLLPRLTNDVPLRLLYPKYPKRT